MQLLHFLTDHYHRNKDIKELGTYFKIRKELKFKYFKIICQEVVEMSNFFNRSVNGNVFKQMFNDLKPNIDYNDSYLKILNLNFSLKWKFCVYIEDASKEKFNLRMLVYVSKKKKTGSFCIQQLFFIL